jgi:hypothetical protein
MDTVRPTSGASRRTGSLLVLALAAAVVVPGLAPVTAADAGAAPAPLVEVVVTSTSEGVAAVTDAVRAAGGTVLDALPLAGGVSAELPAGAVLAPSFTVVDNAPITLASSEVASPGRKATAVREALGLGAPAGQGAGVLIAVVDTGVAEVRDLAGRLTPIDVSGSWEAGEPRDAYGHGTFVAGVAAGTARPEPARVRRRGTRAPPCSTSGWRTTGRDRPDHGPRRPPGGLGRRRGRREPLAVLGQPAAVPGRPAHRRAHQPVAGRHGRRGADRQRRTPQGIGDLPRQRPDAADRGRPGRAASADRSDDTVPDFSGAGPRRRTSPSPSSSRPAPRWSRCGAPGSVVDVANPGSRLEGAYFLRLGHQFRHRCGRPARRPSCSPVSPRSSRTRSRTGPRYGVLGQGPAARQGRRRRRARPERRTGRTGSRGRASRGPTRPPAGDEQAWQAFLQALIDGDRSAAAAAWADLSPAAHKWAAHKWASDGFVAHKGARTSGETRAGPRTSGPPATSPPSSGAAPEGRAQVGRAQVGSDSFVAHKWAAHKWADDDWAAHKWAAHKWAAHKRAASSWS